MVKKFWFQIHWLLGITAGSVLAVMGVTGAVLSFEHDLLRWMNPGVMTITPGAKGPLPPHELLARVQAAYPEKRISGLHLSAHPEDTARIGFATSTDSPGGQGSGGRRSEWRYVDPYTGTLLGKPRGEQFFRVTTEIHRWLVVGDIGKAITGASTFALLVLCLSGLYLRWPRKAWDWRMWLKFNPSLKGRSFLRHLHVATGTWVLLLYLLAGLTGLYWSYEWYRNSLFALTGAPRPNREATTLDTPATTPPDIATVWTVFLRESAGFTTATLSLPRKPTQAAEIRYLDPHPAHERAFNHLVLHPVSGDVIRHDRYTERPLGTKLMNSIFALHSGSFFGLSGVVLMMVASLLMPLFAITGWQLYLGRRAKRQNVRATAATVTLSPSSVNFAADVEKQQER